MKHNAAKPLLTISLLISNRPDTIPRCLDSLQPIREAIPSELILVDTSKNPEIHTMLLEYTDLVYEFEWCKDFAKARNVGLKKARGEWFMFLDDDEWFVDTKAIIDFFQTKEYKQYGCANYQIRNFMDPAYSRYTDGWGTRLYKIGKESAFYSKVHEYLAPIQGAKKHLNAMAYHSGYIFVSEEEQQAHFERNTSLLYEMIKEEPNNMRWKMQLTQEYAAMKKWEELESYSKECINSINAGKLACADDILCCFFSGYVWSLGPQKKYEQLIRESKRLLKDNRCIEVFQWQLHYRLMEGNFFLENWDEAWKYGKLFLEEVGDSQKQEKAKSYQNVILLLGEVFNLDRIARTYMYMVICDLEKGNTDFLKEHYDQLKWNDISAFVNSNLATYFLDIVEKREYDAIFARFVTDICKVPALRTLLVMDALTRKDSDSYNKILYAFAQADANDIYVAQAKLRVADWDGDTQNFLAVLKECFETTDNALNLCDTLSEITDKKQIDIYFYWKYVGTDSWKTSTRTFMKGAKEATIKHVTSQIERVFASDNWRRLYYEMYLAIYEKENCLTEDSVKRYVDTTFKFYERYLKSEDEMMSLDYEALIEKKRKVRLELLEKREEESYEELELRFYHYMIGTLEYYLSIYRDAAFEGELELLPPEARASVWLNDFFGMEESDWEGKIASLRECARACQTLGERIKTFANLLAEYRDACVQRKAQDANAELLQMVEAMKSKICEMAEKGLRQEALAVLVQVRALAPKDSGLIELEKELKHDMGQMTR